MGQLKCASWNMHHTVSISLLKTLHLIQHDIFFSIYWFFSYQYIAVLSFSMWTFYVFKTSAWVSDFLTKKQLYYSFIISKILVYFLFDKPLKFNGKKFVTQKVLHSWHFWQHISLTNLFWKEIYQCYFVDTSI